MKKRKAKEAGERGERVRPEDLFYAAMTRRTYQPPAVQHKFHPSRRWRFDFAWPSLMVAVEIEGGIFVAGRHVRPSGFIKDCEKYNAAAANGWLVLRFPVVGKDWCERAADETILALQERSISASYR